MLYLKKATVFFALIFPLVVATDVSAANAQKDAATSSTQNPLFNLINKPQIPDLSFKQIMRAFYGSQLTRGYIDDEELSKMPHIGLGQKDEEGLDTVALMHPVVSYVNMDREPRFLIIIEKIQVNKDGLVISCHACTATADLYSFKRLPNGSFQLVSRTPKEADFSGSWGRMGLDGKEISANIRPLGKNLVGSVFTNGYTGTGETSLWWEALHLPEDNFINSYGIGDAGGNNSGNHEEDSPLNFSYEVKLSVLNNGAPYYPIRLTYTGDKPTENYDRIVDANFSEVVNFDPIEKKYK